MGSEVWPRIPLMWLDLAQWMEGKSDFPPTPQQVKVQGIKTAIADSEWLLKRATKAKDAEKDHPCLVRMQNDLLLRTGECKGLTKELGALRDYLGQVTTAKKEMSQRKQAAPEPTLTLTLTTT